MPSLCSLPPIANVIPPEILLQIFCLLNPRDFDNARRICSLWMRVSLDHALLASMLKRAGWWDAWLRDCQRHLQPWSPAESLVWRMSRRFSTECLLSGRKTNVERPGFLSTGVVDFSKLAQQHSLQNARFNVSMCGNYVLVSSGCSIHVYRLRTKKVGLMDKDIDLVASIPCPDSVVSATIDTSAPRFVVAALLQGRVGMVGDIISGSCQYYYDLCSPEAHPPRSVSICPGRRCVAFGGRTGIELRWVDEASQQACRKHLPMTQPSEILHFLPSRPDIPEELRLISSFAGPIGRACYDGPQHPEADVHSLASLDSSNSQGFSIVRAAHCHHYRAIPVNDGLHILFVDPRTGFLCIGSDAPLAGPANLTRALVCAPPIDTDNNKATIPTSLLPALT